MVGVGVEKACAQRRRGDLQPVLGLDDVCPERSQLGAQGGKPVGLMASDVRDPSDDARCLGERAERCHHRGQLARVVQVDVDAGDAVAGRDGQAAPVEHDLGPHHVEDVTQEVASLGRVLRPAGHVDPAAGDERCREELGRVRQVGLDLDVERIDLTGLDPPGVHLAVVDHDPGIAQRLDRHLDVRQARHGPTVVVHGDALVEARRRQQQPGDELRGCRGVQRHGAAGHPAPPVHGERQAAGAAVVEIDAEGSQRADHRSHRPLPGVGVTVEADRPGRESGERGDEAHDVAGEAAVNLATSAHRAGADDPVAAGDVLDLGAEHAQRPGHEQRVAGPQRRPQAGGVIREGSQHEVAVGEGLAAGEDDVCVNRPVGARRGPIS